MREENILYEALYESLLTQLYSGVFRYGEKFPSQQQICRRYNVGITTVRKVMGMLEENGFLRSAPGRRAEVCFRGDDAAYAACLLQRRAAIGDVYLGLEVLMPALYAEGARRCPDPTRLRAGLESIRPGMSGSEACGRAAEYLTQMLLPFRNPVLLDLQADMEHYVRVPALSLPGPTGSPDVAADYAKARLSAFQDLIEQGRTADAEAWLVQMYRKAGRRADRYLGQVQRQCPPAGEELPYRWFSCKGRAHLYTVVARSLYRRALAGEFAEDAYLPSVPVLMQTYGVSKSTACAAVALLSDIGFVRTLDKKGSVLRQGGELPPLRLERNVIDEQLILFLDALQILAVCAKPLTLAVFSAQTAPPPPPPAKPPASLSRIVPLLLDLLRRQAPHDCLRNVMEQFDELLIWGHYLRRIGQPGAQFQAAEREAARQYALLCAAWREQDAAACADAMQAVLRLAYLVAREHVCSCASAPERLPLALDEKIPG